MRKATIFFLIIIPLLGFVDNVSSVSKVAVSKTDSINSYILGRINPEILPKEELLSKAMKGYNKLLKSNKLLDPSILTLIDFSLPSDQKRMWVIDMVTGEVLFHTLVAHGRNSGELFAMKFSNKVGSYASSPGFYTTGVIYEGKHGMSLYLDGLEKGINDQARVRAIVMHSAEYVSEEFISQTGRLGRSLGCPSIPKENHKEIISTIQGGTCLYIHTEKGQYLRQSKLLR